MTNFLEKRKGTIVTIMATEILWNHSRILEQLHINRNEIEGLRG